VLFAARFCIWLCCERLQHVSIWLCCETVEDVFFVCGGFSICMCFGNDQLVAIIQVKVNLTVGLLKPIQDISQ